MRGRASQRLIAALVAALLLPLPSAAFSQPAGAPPSTPSPASVRWPRQIEASGNTILIYQPQIDSWDGFRLKARAAVSVQTAGSSGLTYGVIWITARTDVDKVQGLVTLHDVKIAKGNFPGAPQRANALLALIRQHAANGVRVFPLAEMEANLAIVQAKQSVKSVPVKNTPPQIIFSTSPTVLVRIDSAPSLRQLQGSPLMRVINTRNLILLDPATGHYYLSMLDRWLQAPSVDGPWAAAQDPPAALDAAKQAAVAAGQVDLLDPSQTGLPPGTLPTIYVATGPAELIETQGPPEWSPVPGTNLLYVSNTAAHVLLELQTQQTYVLISGRWFRGPSMNGPWQYVSAKQLPPDFARIPEKHPQGVVLASVAGTPQAQEAVIANSIPQTATIVRSEAQLTVTYDGAPQFQPMVGTPLQYAVNTATPVIRVDPVTYYSLYNGVWFVAAAPLGPWVTATSVPAVVYAIPPSSPLYYVTYVRVYGYTPTLVYVGYTPGYLGTIVAPDGVVVYGTGVVYAPWVGTVWYPPPATYGAGASQFAWGAATGFMLGTLTGMAIGAAVWGSSCCHWNNNVNINKTVNNYTVNGSNVYHGWDSKTVVSSGSDSDTIRRTANSTLVTNNQNNNVYASHDGNVYKKDNGSWQKWNGNSQSWQNVQSPRSSSGSPWATRSSGTQTDATTSPRPQTQEGFGRQDQGVGQSQGSGRQSAWGQGGYQRQEPGSGQGQDFDRQSSSGAQYGGQRASGDGFNRQSSWPSESLQRDSWARERGEDRGGWGGSGFRGGGFRFR